jgi:CRISPR/Cas system-associated endoribonuclease Cas2
MGYVVISYDISDDRTRRRVANLLMDYGKRVQGNDSIRVYQLCESCVKNVVLLGKGELTEEAKFHLV